MDRQRSNQREKRLSHCHLCWNRHADSKIEFHHISYDPELTVPLCEECHTRIHADDAVRPDLTPELTRNEAERRGLVSEVPEIATLSSLSDDPAEKHSPDCEDCGASMVMNNDFEWFCLDCEHEPLEEAADD